MKLKYILLALLSLSVTAVYSGDQVKECRDNWHAFLPEAIRSFPTSPSVKAYCLNRHVEVYEPDHFQRVLIWIPGNAFMFDEPTSHVSFLSYLAHTTGTKIFALSHRKIPEFTHQDMQGDLLKSIEFLKDHLKGASVSVGGDSSGAMLVMELMPEWLNSFTIDELIFVAPIFHMKGFLNHSCVLDAYPEEAREAISGQHNLMQFIASLLSKNEDLSGKIPHQEMKNLPKTHIICFEYDVFCDQAVQFQETFDNVTLDLKKGRYHVDYLLKTVDEDSTDVVSELFQGLK